MIDFHSHVLPAIDDGARNTKMSLEMLNAAITTGVTTVIATPHCYIDNEDSIRHFLSHRQYAYDRLMSVISEKKVTVPNIILGSESHICLGISRLFDLEKLCIENTNYILLEMPYEPWQDWMFEEVYEITLRGLRPIIAHLDRYLSQKKFFLNLYSIDALFQINAAAFLNSGSRRKLLDLFENDAAHVVGSDMHNITTRPQNLAKAYEMIEKKFGWEYVDFLQNNSYRIINNDVTLPTRLPRPGFIKKLFI